MSQNHDISDILGREILGHEGLTKGFQLVDLIFVSNDEKIFGHLHVQSGAQLPRIEEVEKVAHHQRLHVGDFHHVRLLRMCQKWCYMLTIPYYYNHVSAFLRYVPASLCEERKKERKIKKER